MEEPRRNIPFDVLIDDSFVNICTESGLSPIENKTVLGFANDYEDGDWWYEKFQDFLLDHIVEVGLTEKERNSLGPHSQMKKSAKQLRLDSTGGEIGEILMYAILREWYGALPIMPKIFFKENVNDPAKGADSVHIVIKDDNFEIWFGEAKFYNDISDTRLYEIVNSVNESLNKDKIRKENSFIITGKSDIKSFKEISEEMKDKILKTLDDSTSIDKIKRILHIPILLLYECQLTKQSIQDCNDETKLKDHLDKIKEYQKERATSYFKKQINKCKEVNLYDKIQFHIILFPVPEKEKIVNMFTEEIKKYR